MDNKIIKQTAYELFGIGAGPEDAKSGKRAAQPAPQPAKASSTATRLRIVSIFKLRFI